MSKCKRAKRVALLAALSTGVLFQFDTGCTTYYAATAASAFDFCSVFNCQGGTYFNFCNPIRLFTDCPAQGTGP